MSTASSTSEPGRTAFARIGSLIRDISRAEGWWEYKAGPILAMAYAAAYLEGVPLHEHAGTLLGIVVALTAVAAAANVLNDWTDLDDDRRAGKANRLEGRPSWFAPTVLAALAGVGAATVASMPLDRLSIASYVANAAVFFAYSTPPLRFKTRGLLGVLADAAGAHVVPGLFAMHAICSSAHVTPSPFVVSVLTVGALAYGLRGILWHQLTDHENDLRTGASTFVCRVGPERATTFGERVAFPLELLSLVVLVVLLRSPLPILAIAADLLLIDLRRRHHQVTSIIVAPKPRFRIALHELHFAVMPLVLLTMSTLRDPWDGTVLLAHFLLFSSRFRSWARDLFVLVGKDLRERRERRHASRPPD